MQTRHTLIAGTEWTWQAQRMRKSAFHGAGASLCGGKPVPTRQRLHEVKQEEVACMGVATGTTEKSR